MLQAYGEHSVGRGHGGARGGQGQGVPYEFLVLLSAQAVGFQNSLPMTRNSNDPLVWDDPAASPPAGRRIWQVVGVGLLFGAGGAAVSWFTGGTPPLSAASHEEGPVFDLKDRLAGAGDGQIRSPEPEQRSGGTDDESGEVGLDDGSTDEVPMNHEGPSAPREPSEADPPTSNLSGGDGSAAGGAAAPPDLENESAQQEPSTLIPPGQFFIQAGSFKVKETAEGVAQQLRREGLEAQAVNYGGPKAGWWHVVRIGPFDSRVAAEIQRLKLPLSHRQSAFVLPRAKGHHHVQVASLRDQQKAESLALGIAKQGHAARVVSVGPAGHVWYTVRVGPFDGREEAEAYRLVLESQAQVQGQVIPFAGE